ncbi:class I SAM-dependent methyltransferase [Marinomonas sp. TW1]|uniref:class I SAM-dependent methyltransferase n=1 Tax=Marinomonas sp. TW1 TaxID=1561203 RepID=UPI0007AF1AF6|nr:class I SAM-dependent methyltransferase [Marinomonas sp. TW1]KZN14763.1 hypothetical protein OA79_03420 [Marinomonas sp. TW1]
MTTPTNHKDFSNGWEAVANEFVSMRSADIGAATVEDWCHFLQPRQSVLDVGCGVGGPYTQCLIDKGVKLHGIDASKTLIQEYRKRFPNVSAACEAAEESSFYDRKHDGILSVGFIFLLSEDNQNRVLQKMARALEDRGKLLFSSPYQTCEWEDSLTGRKSKSLGRQVYIDILRQHGLSLADEYTDEGKNHYYGFEKNIWM